jgi:CheY-like chemotaxis protein
MVQVPVGVDSSFGIYRFPAHTAIGVYHSSRNPTYMLIRPFTVLVVDDNEVHSYALEKMLKVRDYRVLNANCGNEALRIAKEEIPNLILLDVQLPDTSGYQVCRQLISTPETEDIPIVAYSSQELAGNGAAELSGAATFLTYPVDSSTLFAVIDGTLARSGARRNR